MSELIDRQQAIDALKNRWKKTRNYEGIGDDIAEECELYLKQVPPAQPEPKWIPVSERLPRDGTWNIFTDGKNISVERYKADAIDHFFPNGRWFQLEDVIAWMPLPEAYKPNK